ncbi:MAG: N-acetyltransferase [Acidobacteria bacterium]|jgi:RimJ/RimL family protein N-acetyltransferase|nr:N-acetyltransferase [Acidobacteriota bacterium]
MMETERLAHRKFTLEDLPKLIELRSDEAVIRHLGGRSLQNPENIEKRLHFYIECYEKYGFGMCALVWKPTGEMIGWSGLQPLENTGETEVGYGMIKEFWGKGIGCETAKGWLEYGFGKASLERIVAVAAPENTASWRIMEKLGMRREKTETFYGMECFFYAIAENEFAKSKNL